MSDRLLKLSEVARKISMGRTWIYAQIKADNFPRPLQLSPSAVRWRESEVDAWIDRQQNVNAEGAR
jgi:prophage regulatory protein